MEPITKHTAEAATAQGFEPISTGFLPCENRLLESLVAGLRGKTFLLVSTPSGTEVWRPAGELRKANDDVRSYVRVTSDKRGPA